MNGKIPKAAIILLLTIVPLVATSGCLDIYDTKKVFFPEHKEVIRYTQGMIAEVRYNFTGGFGQGRLQVLTQEYHFSVDNFQIGKGGGDLYIWGQIHFGADTERKIKYTRVIEVSLYYIPAQGEFILKAHKTYQAPPTGRFDTAEMIDRIQGAEPGLWSLRVIGNGTASSTADVPFYDWYQVTVNGRYSDDSYNHNAPFSSGND